MRAVYSKQRLGFSGFQVDIVRHTNLLAELNHFFYFDTMMSQQKSRKVRSDQAD